MGLDTGLKLAVSFGTSFVIALIFQFLIVGRLKDRIVRMKDERETGTLFTTNTELPTTVHSSSGMSNIGDELEN